MISNKTKINKKWIKIQVTLISKQKRMTCSIVVNTNITIFLETFGIEGRTGLVIAKCATLNSTYTLQGQKGKYIKFSFSYFVGNFKYFLSKIL